MSRLLLVSNRLPVALQSTDTGVRLVRSSGGLVAGLGPVHDSRGGQWIGTLGLEADTEISEQLREQRLQVVIADPEDIRRHYEGYSNGVLWPLFHYLLETVDYDSEDFAAYQRVNECFADAVAKQYRAGDQIWVHDYQLLLLPRMLRERIPDATIGFFLHIPFPSSEVFRLLPRNDAILRGLLGANLIGVHTYDYGRHLVSSFSRVLGVDFDEDWSSRESVTRVGVYPLGVDVEAFQERSRKADVQTRVAEIGRDTRDRTLILGVDRMDYTKGLPLRLRAFSEFLTRRPDLARRLSYLQLAVPSRETVQSYIDLKEEVDRLVGSINGRFGAAGHSPINYLYRSVGPDELVAMYRAAGVMWVTPIRDGMNLVAKEYVASRIADDGVLVLSEFAGAAAEMGEALLHNPWDIEGTAEVLERAIEMRSEERARRMRTLRTRVARNDIHRWVNRYLEALDQVGRELRDALSEEDVAPLEEWQGDLRDRIRTADRALLVLDYDGTLMELHDEPERAAPTEKLRRLLRSLASLATVDVVVSSGRDPETLERWLGELPLMLIGEHGLRWRLDDEWQDLFSGLETSWMDSTRDVLEDYTSRLPGSFVETKNATLVWHYRKSLPGFGEWLARDVAAHLREVMANAPVEILRGHKIVEIRPQGIGKGAALRRLLSEREPYDIVVVVGDDRTDEDMFEVIPSIGVSIKVGRDPTAAMHRLANPKAVRTLLRSVVDDGASGAAP
ncbi:MAG: bifunctional alpha,alpha-trehalose-phosphate synthase (UDP-forming)/trehalose-phosphatase [Myxococcota bacterium]